MEVSFGLGGRIDRAAAQESSPSAGTASPTAAGQTEPINRADLYY
jgi:hypothetical protein